MAIAATQTILADLSETMFYVLPSLGLMLIFYGVYQVIVESKTSDRKKLRERLRGQQATQEKDIASIMRRGAIGESKSFADTVIGKLKFIPKLQTLLDQAAVDWSASQTVLNLGGLALVLTAGLAVLQFNLIVALGAGVAVLMLPIVWLSMRRKRRMIKLTSQLPDVFEMMSQALRAGHSLAGAIQTVYEQLPPPVATEFARVYHEQNLGIKIEEALKAMANRVDSLDIRFFVTAVMIQRQTGGDLAEVLDNISSVIRGRIELQGLVRGLTAEGRLSGWVLFALPFVVLGGVLVMNPDYGGALFDEPLGQIMLMIAAGMQLMGLAMIRWIVNIKL